MVLPVEIRKERNYKENDPELIDILKELLSGRFDVIFNQVSIDLFGLIEPS